MSNVSNYQIKEKDRREIEELTKVFLEQGGQIESDIKEGGDCGERKYRPVNINHGYEN